MPPELASTMDSPPPAEAGPTGSWRQRYPALHRFLRSKVAVAGLAMIVLLILTAVVGPHLWHIGPNEFDEEKWGSPEGPSWTHPAGTDRHGRDMLARLMVGAQISLAVGVVSMLINLIIGVGLGTLAGWIGGWVDTVIMRTVDALYSIPLLLIVILLQIFVRPVIERVYPPDVIPPLLLSPELISIYLALGLANWLTMARLARAEVINLSQMDYVAASRGLGASNRRLLLRHVLPNSVPPLLVAATLAIPEAIFIESFLAFIGVGVSAPQASWGTLANDAVSSMSSTPHLLLFPALAISVAMLSFNLFGDGLRDALDPKMSR